MGDVEAESIARRSIFGRYSAASRAAITESAAIAQKTRARGMDTWHLLFALADMAGGTAVAAMREDARRFAVLSSQTEAIWSGPGPDLDRNELGLLGLPMSPELKHVLVSAAWYADARSDPRIRTGDLLLALIDEPRSVTRSMIAPGLLARRQLRAAAWRHLVASDPGLDEVLPSTAITST